jgi:sugar phosphate isomerase/epimerase
MLSPPPLSLGLIALEDDPDLAGVHLATDPRRAIEWAASLGYRAVQLDVARAGLRPRELDRSARRDLASLLRRRELTLSGLDLFIPPEHLIDAAQIDRAVAAISGAMELAVDLAALAPGSIPCVSLVLPKDLAADTRQELGAAASRAGALLADFAVGNHRREAPPDARSTDQPSRPIDVAGHAVGIGIDPAALILRGDDPIEAVTHAGDRLFAARLTDAAHSTRIAPGSSGSQLDQTAYAAALSVVGFHGPTVVDLRGVSRPGVAARALAPGRAE